MSILYRIYREVEGGEDELMGEGPGPTIAFTKPAEPEGNYYATIVRGGVESNKKGPPFEFPSVPAATPLEITLVEPVGNDANIYFEEIDGHVGLYTFEAYDNAEGTGSNLLDPEITSATSPFFVPNGNAIQFDVWVRVRDSSGNVGPLAPLVPLPFNYETDFLPATAGEGGGLPNDGVTANVQNVETYEELGVGIMAATEFKTGIVSWDPGGEYNIVHETVIDTLSTGDHVYGVELSPEGGFSEGYVVQYRNGGVTILRSNAAGDALVQVMGHPATLGNGDAVLTQYRGDNGQGTVEISVVINGDPAIVFSEQTPASPAGMGGAPMSTRCTLTDGTRLREYYKTYPGNVAYTLPVRLTPIATGLNVDWDPLVNAVSYDILAHGVDDPYVADSIDTVGVTSPHDLDVSRNSLLGEGSTLYIRVVGKDAVDTDILHPVTGAVLGPISFTPLDLSFSPAVADINDLAGGKWLTQYALETADDGGTPIMRRPAGAGSDGVIYLANRDAQLFDVETQVHTFGIDGNVRIRLQFLSENIWVVFTPNSVNFEYGGTTPSDSIAIAAGSTLRARFEVLDAINGVVGFSAYVNDALVSSHSRSLVDPTDLTTMQALFQLRKDAEVRNFLKIQVPVV